MGKVRVTLVLVAALPLLTITFLAGCKDVDSNTSADSLPRPVSYTTLQTHAPQPESLVTGSVESWKSEQVSFQVGGRVGFVREPGTDIHGRILDSRGTVLESGTLLASLESDRYEIRHAQAQAVIQQAESQVQAIKVDIEKTIPGQLAEVQAEYKRAQQEYARQERLLKEGAGARRAVETARAQFSEAKARRDQVRARKFEQEARLAAAEAKVLETKEAARSAEIDLRDTDLHVPYNGQISKAHVIPGGYVQPGQPVLTVQMMDPVKVELAVSAELDRKIHFNDVFNVYVDGIKEPLRGWVWHKDTVADASTRTFMVTLIIRNRQLEVDTPSELSDQDVLRVNSLWNLETRQYDGEAPFFTNVETLQQDAEGYFVWKAEGLQIKDLEGDFNPLFKVRKLRVIPGEEYKRFLQIFTYRVLEDIGGLNPETDLIAGKLPEGVEDGDTLMLTRKQWLLRPGQLAKVDLQQRQLPTGFYVPIHSVLKNESGHHVFVVKDRGDGLQNAVQVAVRPGQNLGALQAVSPETEGSLSAGAEIVVDGASYLRDGDLIATTSLSAEVRP